MTVTLGAVLCKLRIHGSVRLWRAAMVGRLSYHDHICNFHSTTYTYLIRLDELLGIVFQ